MRSPEVKIYLFLFSPKCTFLYTFMFLSNCAYGAVNETHIFGKYRFRTLFYILVFHNRSIFKESIWGQTRRSKRSKRGQLTQNWKIYLYMQFFGANTHLILLGLQKYGFISTFYFLVCLSRAIFKDFIGGQTRVSKKVKKRSINSKLENLPMDALFHYR